MAHKRQSEEREIAAVRKIYKGQETKAALCITLDYDKVFQPFKNILTEDTRGIIIDETGGGAVCFMDELEEGKKRGRSFEKESGKLCVC